MIPLDLCAVEAKVRLAWESNDAALEYAGNDAIDDVEALLAHCRALRVALRPFQQYQMLEDGKCGGSLPDEVAKDCIVLQTNTRPFHKTITVADFRRAAAVLAQATDGERT